MWAESQIILSSLFPPFLRDSRKMHLSRPSFGAKWAMDGGAEMVSVPLEAAAGGTSADGQIDVLQRDIRDGSRPRQSNPLHPRTRSRKSEARRAGCQNQGVIDGYRAGRITQSVRQTADYNEILCRLKGFN